MRRCTAAAGALAAVDVVYHVAVKSRVRRQLGIAPGRARALTAAHLRRIARWLDGYPVEFLGPVHGENGVRRLGEHHAKRAP